MTQEKIRALVLSAILAISISLSFGLGYLADRHFNHAPIIIEQCSQQKEPS
jgi:hypothetical protein